MHQLAGTISSVVKSGLELFTPTSFQTGKFPTKLRYLYLKSSKDQNRVTTIGYMYVTPEIIHYHVAKCRQDKPNSFMKRYGVKPVKDIFSRKIGRDIVTGRFNKWQPKEMSAVNKDEMYNKFIYMFHPDRSERRKAKRALMVEMLNQVKLETQENV